MGGRMAETETPFTRTQETVPSNGFPLNGFLSDNDKASIFHKWNHCLFVAFTCCRSPVFQQQGPQDIGSVLSFDLVRNNHLLHHLVGDARQGLLVQIQQHCTCRQTHIMSSAPHNLRHRLQGDVNNRPRFHLLPCEMVFRSSSKLRKDSEATWGFPQRSVSSSTSSSNLIHRAVSFHCISWFLSIVSSFSSTNTWRGHRTGARAGAG